MEEGEKATSEEILQGMQIISLALRRELEKEGMNAEDPYEGYVQRVTLRLFEQFSDLPLALMRGWEVLSVSE